jgi:hypothetical protein
MINPYKSSQVPQHLQNKAQSENERDMKLMQAKKSAMVEMAGVINHVVDAAVSGSEESQEEGSDEADSDDEEKVETKQSNKTKSNKVTNKMEERLCNTKLDFTPWLDNETAKDTYFIIVNNDKTIPKGEQVFFTYGRRNN